MNSLRMRVAGLLVVSIVTVVALATITALFILRPPEDGGSVRSLKFHLEAMLRVATTHPDALNAMGGVLGETPSRGTIDVAKTDELSRAFGASGIAREVKVVASKDQRSILVSLRLPSDRWLIANLPSWAPPENVKYVFAGWMFLILVGSVGVSLVAAKRITMPLAMIEKATASIGPSGEIGTLQESGPAELRETARALNRMSRILRVALESRMRLIAAAGHDLRTPMTRMRLRAEFVSDVEEKERWLADLSELEQIAESAIGLVREEIDPANVEEVAMEKLLQEVVMAVNLAGLSAEFVGAGDFVAKAAPLSMRRALTNLVANAATHGGGAKVSLAGSADRVIVRIEDNGPGIPQELMDQVFEPFFRVDVARRKTYPGAGLGLAIAGEIVSRAGGSIELSNKATGGLLQLVSLPLALAK